MLSVNDLIQNAYTKTGLVGDSQSVNGTRAKTALVELNDLIRTLNMEEYIADSIKTVEVNATKEITISKAPTADIVVDEIPSHIKSVTRKLGNRFIPLYTSNLESIGRVGTTNAKANQYTYNVSYNQDLVIDDETTGGLEGIITLDSNTSDTYRVMYVETLKEYELDDKILLQPMYKGLLLAGLAYKLAIRYKIQDWLNTFKDEFDNQKSLVKRTNSTNRNMTWADNEGSYLDDYYNGMAGRGW